MEQEPAQRQTIAWFKLAEFIKRGEKERALSIYNLLAHTIEDRAFAKHLEGDLLLCFNPEQALESYTTAATMYVKEQRMPNAIAIYEQLVKLFPTNNTVLDRLVDLYQQWHHPTRIVLSLQRFIDQLVYVHQEYALCAAIKRLTDSITQADTFMLLSTLTMATIAHHHDSAHLNTLMQETLAHANTHQTHTFVQYLRTCDNLNNTVLHTINNALDTTP